MRRYKWLSCYKHPCPARFLHKGSTHSGSARICGGPHGISYIPREVRDLILRANRRGSDYGLPLSYITHECLMPQFYNDARTPISIRVCAKVIAGSLVLWRFEEFDIDLSSKLLKQLDAIRAGGCRHTTRSLAVIGVCSLLHFIDGKHKAACQTPPLGG
jgi:hypothetical protein